MSLRHIRVEISSLPKNRLAGCQESHQDEERQPWNSSGESAEAHYRLWSLTSQGKLFPDVAWRVTPTVQQIAELVQELPPKQFADRIVNSFFSGFNNVRYPIDEHLFRTCEFSDSSTRVRGSLPQHIKIYMTLPRPWTPRTSGLCRWSSLCSLWECDWRPRNGQAMIKRASCRA